jgi:hypothetical protein
VYQPSTNSAGGEGWGMGRQHVEGPEGSRGGGRVAGVGLGQTLEVQA